MKLLSIKLYDTYGWIAIASLLVCGLTGVFLIIPFDPVKAYESVTTFVTTNPAASFTRNLHYWSAQMFLIFTIFHFIEHFRKAEDILYSGGEPKKLVRKGTWTRLVLSIIVVFYVMLSGFILKDDADSRQAHLILSSLLSAIPFIGNFLSTAVSGTSESLITLYLHHAATATIIIFIVVFEHVRSIKVKWPTFIITSLIVIVLSSFFRAPLAQANEAVMKGPWFFIGVQEMLHLVSEPLIVVSILFLILVLIFFTPYSSAKTARVLKLIVLITGLAYAIFTITGYFFRGEAYTFQAPWNDGYKAPVMLVRNIISFKGNESLSPVHISDGVEGCMSCHKGMTGLSQSHDPKLIGCYSCHGGDPFTLNADAAHRKIYKVPGNLSNAAQTCGSNGCHEDIVTRLPNSMMATLNGMIAVDKWVFGEAETPDGHYNVSQLHPDSKSPSDVHLMNLCAGCHLGMEKTVPGKAGWLDRGGGCNACHLTYDSNALATLNEIAYLKNEVSASIPNDQSSKIENGKLLYHPIIDINIKNDKCESCHSRSGRISMSYTGWHETQLKKIPDNQDTGKYRQLPDKRIFKKYPADVHHEAGMLCIDCHGSYELMGDGFEYLHKEEAVKIQCIDCHPVNDKVGSSEKRLNSSIDKTDRESQLIAWLRYSEEKNPSVLLTAKSQRPIINTRIDADRNILIRKADNKKLTLKPASPECTKGKAHNRLSCETCHTGWVPQCIGCHNVYEQNTQGYNMLTRQKTKGTWVEYTGENMAELPVLGIKYADKPASQQQVGIFSPGMIMTLDVQSFNEKISKSAQPGNNGTSVKNAFHRLYAPVSGHTTRKESRSCVSCHLDPLAIGYGRGKLILLKNGTWKFEPLYALSKYDGLPEDAWTGFLTQTKGSATRTGMRPFTIEEQKRILRAGACLTCHKEGSKVTELCIEDFQAAINKSTERCIVP